MYAHPDRGSTGDAEAFAALYERYHARLVALCRRRLSNAADAEDVAHEAMLRAYRAFAGFDDRTDAWPWLATIAGRLCTDVRRREQRMPESRAHLPVHDVHEEAVGRLRAGIVDEALDRLPARYRTPLVLHDLAGWTYDEIAQLQGKSVASVRSVLSRGRRRLSVGIESVARNRNQWPLPGAVPDLARRVRAYVRTARANAQRPVQLVLSLVDPSAMLAAMVIGAQATAAFAGVASMAGTTPTAAVADAASSGPDTRSATVEAAVEAEAPLPLDAARQARDMAAGHGLPPATMVEFDSRDSPLPPGTKDVSAAEVVVEAREYSLWVRVRASGDLPYPLNLTATETNVPCQWLLMGDDCAGFRKLEEDRRRYEPRG
jgi:RNA polymerase sigma factor (sigma-70 family)